MDDGGWMSWVEGWWRSTGGSKQINWWALEASLKIEFDWMQLLSGDRKIDAEGTLVRRACIKWLDASWWIRMDSNWWMQVAARKKQRNCCHQRTKLSRNMSLAE